MNTTNTLIILTPGFPSDEGDTTCLPFIQLFVKACKENHQWLKVIVLSFQYPFTQATYNWHGITVKSFNGRNKGKLSRLLTWSKVWKAMKTINKQDDVIGVLSLWLGECALIGDRFSKRNSLKHFTWILGQDAKKHNRYQKLIHADADSLVALSDSIAGEYLKNYGIVPKHLVPVGIDTSTFDLEERIRNIDVLGAGSLIPLKRYDLFVNVIQQLVPHFPKFSAVICGNGPEKHKLLKLVKEASLENNITITDELPHKEVLQLMCRSKVFLHTSAYEGHAVVCVEALYAGAHVVSFCKPMERPGKQEHIVATGEEACNKILEILHDEGRTHEQILNYSIEDISKRMMDLFAW